MFREMRRKKQLLSLDEVIAVLNNGTSGFWPWQGMTGFHMLFRLATCIMILKSFFIVL